MKAEPVEPRITQRYLKHGAMTSDFNQSTSLTQVKAASQQPASPSQKLQLTNSTVNPTTLVLMLLPNNFFARTSTLQL